MDMKKIIKWLISVVCVCLLVFLYINRYEIKCLLEKPIPVDLRTFVNVEYGDDDGGGSSRCEAWQHAKDTYIFNKMGLSLEEVVLTYVGRFSIGKFSIEKIFEDDEFAKFRIIPEDKSHDEARIYLRKSEGVWMVIAGPATSFPDLENHFPELKGR